MSKEKIHKFGDEYMTIKEYAKKSGIKATVISARIAKGKTGTALTEPQVSKEEAKKRAKATMTWRNKKGEKQ